jgi:hypothetical protein
MMTKGLIGFGASLVLIAFVADTDAQEHAAPATMTDEEMIQSAMAAAPEAVAKEATIVAIGADGKLPTLRKVATTSPACPITRLRPAPDPMCGDANAMGPGVDGEQSTPTGKIGFMYMLAAVLTPATPTPHAKGPEPGNNWIETADWANIVTFE